MRLWCWQLAVVADSSSARPHHRLMSMQMDLSLQLVPQLVMLWALHATTQQLDLLDS